MAGSLLYVAAWTGGSLRFASQKEMVALVGLDPAHARLYLDALVQRWPLLLVSGLLLAGAFGSLVPIALALQCRFEASPARDIMVTGLVRGSLFGVVAALIDLGRLQFTVDMAHHSTSPKAIEALAAAAGLMVGPVQWLVSGFILMVGVGVLQASRLGRSEATLSPASVRLGLALAATYGLALVAQATNLSLLFQLCVLLGGAVVAPLWALRLARDLGSRIERPA